MNEIIKEKDYVLLINSKGRSLLREVKKDEKISTNEGDIFFNEIIDKKYGEKITTHLGYAYLLARPTLLDFLYGLFKRKTQVLYIKDIALLLALSQISSGSIVVEAGTGSGFLTACLANIIRPNGKVYTYEIRKDFIEIAKDNLKLLGLLKYAEIKNKDITKGIDERNVDSVILDMSRPWRVIENAKHSLKHGGSFLAFVPTINQVEITHTKLKKEGFIQVTSIEVFLREYKVKKGETRPNSMMIGHTGYIIYAKKP